MILSGASKLAGVMGWPVSHSKSPSLHGYWLDLHKIDGAYVPLPVRPEAFPGCLRALAELGFRGVNLTVPHKVAALDVCDSLDDAARAIGAVNTVVFTGKGIEGRNTDAHGFIENLRQAAPDWHASAGPAVVLGAGGAARAVVHALREAGAPEIRLANRTKERASALAKDFAPGVTVVAWQDRAAAMQGANLLVNTTSLGMTGQDPLELALDALPASALVNDIVYAPLETALLRDAKARGNRTVDGLGMLLHQARPGFAAWFGVTPEVTPALRAFVFNRT
jgi:shikimate dehydrogenase